MYVVHCCDLITGISKEFRYSNKNEEVQLALEIATMLESKSVCLYDRLHFSLDLISAHKSSGSYFFARCKSGETVLSVISEFEKSGKDRQAIEIDGVEITLLKIQNPKLKDYGIFATNLPKKYLKKNRVNELYSLRWGVETVNRDITETLQIEKWHSKKINGILQEVYATLWAINTARIHIASRIKKKDSISPEKRKYRTANLKAILEFLAKNLLYFVKTKSRKLRKQLYHLIDRTMEQRKRLSREAPRTLKYQGKSYPIDSLVPRREQTERY